MAYNYIEQTFTRTISYTASGYYAGGNALAGLIKDFILNVFPDATLSYDNDPINNLVDNTQTRTQRIIKIKINGVDKIRIDAISHATTYPFGYVVIGFIYDSVSQFYTQSVGSGAYSNVVIQALSIPGVGYFIKEPSYTFKNANGYFLSDENEYIIMYDGKLDPLNHNCNYGVLPSGGYNILINNKIVLTELILNKINIIENPQTLRFKNKNIFKNSISNYFSNDRFYLGDDGHKYVLIGANDLLFRLE